MKTNYTTQPDKAYLKPGEWGTIQYTSISYEMPALNATEPEDTAPKYKWVEINGVKWATMNIGAKDIYDPGLYFAWGETEGYTAEQIGTDRVFDYESYKFSDGNEGYSKYNNEDGKPLDPEDDAATINMGEGWRMPTREELYLLAYPSFTAFYKNGKSYGVNTANLEDVNMANLEDVLTNTVQFPVDADSDSSDYFYCRYWSSSAYVDDNEFAYGQAIGILLYGDSADIDEVSIYPYSRYFGGHIRGVYDPTISDVYFDTEVINGYNAITIIIDGEKYYVQGDAENRIITSESANEGNAIFMSENNDSAPDGILDTDLSQQYDVIFRYTGSNLYNYCKTQIDKLPNLKTVNVSVGRVFLSLVNKSYQNPNIYHMNGAVCYLFVGERRIDGWFLRISEDGYYTLINDTELSNLSSDGYVNVPKE